MRPTYRRIWAFMGEFRGVLSGAVITSLGASIVFTLLPWPIRYLIDEVILSDRARLGWFGTYNTATTGEKVAVGAGVAVVYLVIQMVAAVLMSWSFYLSRRPRCG